MSSYCLEGVLRAPQRGHTRAHAQRHFLTVGVSPVAPLPKEGAEIRGRRPLAPRPVGGCQGDLLLGGHVDYCAGVRRTIAVSAAAPGGHSNSVRLGSYP